MLNFDSVLTPNPACKTPLFEEAMVVASIFVERNRIWLVPYITNGTNKTKFPDKKPIEFLLSEVEAAIQSDEIALASLQLESYKSVPAELLYDADGNLLPSVIERDRRFKIVRRALEDEDELFYATHGNSVVAKVAKEFKSTPRNVQRYLNEYFRGGRHINSLITRRGRHERTFSVASKKIGAKPHGSLGKNVDLDDKVSFKKILKKYYLNKDRMSLEAVYKKLLDEEYALQKGKILPDGTITQTIHVHPDERVSIGQLRYWTPEVLGLSRLEIKAQRRQGPDHKSNFEGRSGDGAYIAMGPGHIFQMDSTEIDIVLVSPYDRRVTIDKVTIYAIRDVYTRSFVGLHLASGKASWFEARLALLNAFRDKKSVAAECGVIIDDDDWIESGVPQILLVDNEEFANKISESVGKDLGLIVVFSRAYAGDDKGLIEVSFSMFHSMLRNEKIAGFQYKNLMGRNRQLPRKTSALTPRELLQILTLYVIYHNRCIWKDDYPMEQAASIDGVKNICRDYWLWGLKNRPYFIRKKPARELYLSLLEVGELTVHRTHLMLQDKHLKYRCDDTRVRMLQDKIEGRGKKQRLSCRYIRSTVNKILIEVGGEFVLGELHSEQQRFMGLSHPEFQAARLRIAENKALHNEQIQSARADLSTMVSFVDLRARKIRDEHVNQLANIPKMTTKEATNQLRAEAFQQENQKFDDATSYLKQQPEGSEAALDATSSDTYENHTTESPIEDTDSLIVLDDLLKELNHG